MSPEDRGGLVVNCAFTVPQPFVELYALQEMPTILSHTFGKSAERTPMYCPEEKTHAVGDVEPTGLLVPDGQTMQDEEGGTE